MSTEKFKQERASGIGGSDMAAILGLTTWGSRFSIWAKKTGQIPDEIPDNEYMWMGRKLEPVAIEIYEEKTGNKVKRDVFQRHPEYDYIMGHFDGVIMDGDKPAAILEIKTTKVRNWDKWGEPGTDEVPENYLIQCMQYLAISGLPYADLAVLMDNELKIYRIDRDEDLIKTITEEAVKFWNTYVIPKVSPPEITGLSAEKEAVAAMFKTTAGKHISGVEDPDLLDAATKYLDANLIIKEQTERKKLAGNIITRWLLDRESETAEAPGLKITWKSGKPRVGWSKVADELIEIVPADKSAEIIAKHTSEASRTLRVARTKR